MLPHEIEPFADAHIDALKTMIEQMEFYIANPEELNPRVVEDWRRALHVSIGGITRFKVCMVDEVEQKEKYHQTLLDHRIRPNFKPSP